MKKSILRFGALALMSLMSIGAFAEKGDVFYVNGHKFSVLEEASAGASGKAKLEMVNSGVGVNLSGDITRSETQKYKVTEVAEDACYYVGAETAITLPSVIKIGNHAFANSKVTVTFAIPENAGKYTLGSGSTIGEYAFENAKIGGDVGYTYDFSKVTLPEGAFNNATFSSGVTIEMGEATSLADYVFGTTGDDGIGDIQSIVFDFPSAQFTTVGKFALKGRTGLIHFGYKESEGSYWLPVGLKEVGESAFAGCSSILEFAFTLNAKNSCIKSVGKNAFQGCSWLNDEKFANSFRSFATLSFKEGSFQDCNLTSVDLTNWNTIDVMTIGEDEEQQTLKGIPANAFAGNPITALTYPVVSEENKLEAIGDGAFNGNELQNVKFPEGLVYVGNDAFAKNTIQTGTTEDKQTALYLPASLKSIGKDALKNRYIVTVYTYYEAQKEEGKYVVPVLGAQADLTIENTVVPVVPEWSAKNEGDPTSLVQVFERNGWKDCENEEFDYNVRYAKIKTGGTVDWGIDNMTLSIVGNTSPDQNPDGTYSLYPTTYSTATIEIKGMYDNSDDGINVESEGGKDWPYAVIFRVTAPDNGNVPVSEGVKVKSITFSPETKVGSYLSTYPDFNSGYTTVKGTFLPASANINKDLSVKLNAGVTEVAEGAFKDVAKLTNVTLPETLTKVGNSAFEETGITEITLPRSLQTIGNKSFNTASLKTVTVSYDATSGTDLCPIPNITVTEDEETFNAATKVLVVNASEGKGTATRENYLANATWSQFFETATKVSVKTTDEDATLAAVASVDDVDDEGNVTRVFELSDNNDIAEVKITLPATEGAVIPAVRYNRKFASNVFQCWYVPFNLNYEEARDDCEFYYIYNTTQKGSVEADAEPVIELKKVTPGEGVVIKGNTPYIIKPKNSNVALKFAADAIMNTEETHFTVTNAQYTYEFEGTYQRKQNSSTATAPSDWYGIGANGFTTFGPGAGINAYRFFMTIGDNNGSPYWEYQNVKFVVLDDEDATSIEDVKSGSLSAPMFDLMGRQITAPAKGQVYIQNGVKKLAK